MDKFLGALRTFFVLWVWQTFCVEWVWRTFCVKWFWRGLCVNILYKKFDSYKAWIYLSPAIILLLIFTVWPMINTFIMAFWEGYSLDAEQGAKVEAQEIVDYIFRHEGRVIDPPNLYPYKFGFDNFYQVVFNPESGFLNCLKNTMVLCFLTVPISTLLALVIAVALNSIKPLRKMLQTIFFLPYVTNSIAIGMVFSVMFNIVGFGYDGASVGVMNTFLGWFGLGPVNWMNWNSDYWANTVVLVVYIVWNALPFKILVLLGGLQSVNKQYYDAAKIDSTPRLRVFTRITVPLLSPMIAYVVITGFIGGFKEYTSVIGIFGDPAIIPGGTNWNTMVGYIYDQLGKQEGRASAAALVLFVIIFIVTMINMHVSKKKTHY